MHRPMLLVEDPVDGEVGSAAGYDETNRTDLTTAATWACP